MFVIFEHVCVWCFCKYRLFNLNPFSVNNTDHAGEKQEKNILLPPPDITTTGRAALHVGGFTGLSLLCFLG